MTKTKSKEGRKKDCIFQFATRHKVYEDTELITREEADALWEKYIGQVKEEWDELSSPEMCIWIDCESNTDFHTRGRDVDFRNCELENGNFYRVTKVKI